MDDIIVINSELLEEKIQKMCQVKKLLDNLHFRLFRLRESNQQILKKDLYVAIHSVEEMQETAEELYSALRKFLGEMDDMTVHNRKELEEFKEMITELFI